jgi:hypothetical protein
VVGEVEVEAEDFVPKKVVKKLPPVETCAGGLLAVEYEFVE